MFDIITFGSAFKDTTIKSKGLKTVKYPSKIVPGEGFCLPMGSKVELDEMYFNTGGGGTNTAATFSLQGFKTAFLGTIGNDSAGQEVIVYLYKFGIDTKFVIKNHHLPTSQSIIILDEAGGRTILFYGGASSVVSKKNISWGELHSKWFYIAPLTGSFISVFEQIIDFANVNKIKVAINPSLQQLSLSNKILVTVCKKIDVLFLNQEEASFLTNVPFQKEKAIFKKIDQMCLGVAVMTKGGDGVVVSDGKFLYSAKPNPKRKIIDTTGAGDSFASGFLSDFIRTNGDIEKAIQLGMANSQGCLSEIGAKNGLLKKGKKFEKVKVFKRKI